MKPQSKAYQISVPQNRLLANVYKQLAERFPENKTRKTNVKPSGHVPCNGGRTLGSGTINFRMIRIHSFISLSLWVAKNSHLIPSLNASLKTFSCVFEVDIETSIKVCSGIMVVCFPRRQESSLLWYSKRCCLCPDLRLRVNHFCLQT